MTWLEVGIFAGVLGLIILCMAMVLGAMYLYWLYWQ